MSAEYVRNHYGVDFKRGDRVTVDGRPGVIVSFPDQYLGVRFDGETHTTRAHPTWRVAKAVTDLCQPCADQTRCDRCQERMCESFGPEPRACGVTCVDCPCDCEACLLQRQDMRAEIERQIERDAS